MNDKRRALIRRVKDDLEALKEKLETLRERVKILHDEEYGYREGLWKKGLDESDTADVSDDALDMLNQADTYLMRATMLLEKAMQ